MNNSLRDLLHFVTAIPYPAESWAPLSSSQLTGLQAVPQNQVLVLMDRQNLISMSLAPVSSVLSATFSSWHVE
jgi:hypothetical protein